MERGTPEFEGLFVRTLLFFVQLFVLWSIINIAGDAVLYRCERSHPSFAERNIGLVPVLCLGGSTWLDVTYMFKIFTGQSLGLPGLLTDTVIMLYWVLSSRCPGKKIILAVIYFFTSV